MDAPRRVTAVLGPTNTGKTHHAIERMLSHRTGVIGLPLRLLAREVYDKISTRVGANPAASNSARISAASPAPACLDKMSSSASSSGTTSIVLHPSVFLERRMSP